MSDSPVARKASSKKSAKPAVRKEKKRKDPNAPKRPLSAYILFGNAKRAQVKADNPDITFGGVGKEISRLWKEVTSSEKKKFEAAAAEDKKRYEREMEDYAAAGGETSQPAKKTKRAAPASKAKSESEGEDEEDEEDDE